jgi:hypothetical protein
MLYFKIGVIFTRTIWLGEIKIVVNFVAFVVR